MNYFLNILLVSTLVLSICDADESVNINGQLIYTDGGSSVNAISWGSSGCRFSSLYKNEEISAIDHLTRVNSDAVLFGECNVMGDCVIRRYSLDAKQGGVIRTGRMPSYISNHDKLFFYDESFDGKKWLFMAPLGDVKNAEKIFEEPKWMTLPSGINQSVAMPVTQISNDEVIFVGEDRQLWLYDITNSELVPMDIGDCRPILWRNDRDQLLCSDWDTWDMFLLDIRSKGKVDLPGLKGAYGFVYIPSSDALIYGRTRSRFVVGEAYDIFFYSFSNQKEKRIKKDFHLAGGVWIEG